MASDLPLWGQGWREEAWSHLDQEWDLIIIGGGITGAGLLNEAGRRGWKALLLEERDFAWGTSSRSSKLIHGGMRYMKQWKYGLTRSLLRERDLLLEELPGLVEPLPFLLPTYADRRTDRILYTLAVTFYDLLRGVRKSWAWRSSEEIRALVPGVAEEKLQGGFQYLEAITEDARLVLRVIREGMARGGIALNYARADSLLNEGGKVVGVELCDGLGDRRMAVRGRLVVNATGAAGDQLRGRLGRKARLRPLRGAHLVIPRHRLPLDHGVSFRHPGDGRHLYLIPWEGTTLVGATDLDHGAALNLEPKATEAEVQYLLDFVNQWVPGGRIAPEDLLSTFAGVRPVVWTGRRDTHNEGRDSLFWDESGLVTVISGKLTEFRGTVRKALGRLSRRLRPLQGKPPSGSFFSQGSVAGTESLSEAQRRRLLGRYGADLRGLMAAAGQGEMEEVLHTPVLWAEVRWGARAEGVAHLDDLLLRRVRLGLILPEGGKELLPRVRRICQEELGWDDGRWEEEEARYLEIIRESYAVPLPSHRTPPA